jgi:hypothetical protein
MKTLITAAMLLALTSPAFAAKARQQDLPDIRDWQDMDWVCNRGMLPEDEPGQDLEELHPARHKVCAMAAKLEKRLTAMGYCTYGKGGVGRPGKKYFYIDANGTRQIARHCYWIDNLPAE